MPRMFLDPKKPLYECKENTCDGCSIASKLTCHFNGRQLAIFLLLNIPLFVTAGYFIYRYKPLFLAIWIIFVVTYFGFIEIRVMCSHCPHYGEPHMKTLKCWANYGSPKLWKYRPGPMSILEKAIFSIGLAAIFLPAVIILIIQKSFIFLGLYIAIFLLWKLSLETLYCNHCINFACPINRIDENTRNDFFKKNPRIARAWGKSEKI